MVMEMSAINLGVINLPINQRKTKCDIRKVGITSILLNAAVKLISGIVVFAGKVTSA
jgi:hypothetical protein